MRIIAIFEKIKDKLFAASFEEAGKLSTQDELDKAFDFWRDIEQVRQFFMTYRSDLIEFAPSTKVARAVRQCVAEAEAIFDHLVNAADHDGIEVLDTLFRPLDNRELGKRGYEFQAVKAKAEMRNSFLRLYAVRYHDCFVITGGTIKVTQGMDTRPHLKQELRKLELTRKFLQQDEAEAMFVYLDVNL